MHDLFSLAWTILVRPLVLAFAIGLGWLVANWRIDRVARRLCYDAVEAVPRREVGLVLGCTRAQAFWRVVVGPAESAAELETLTTTIKAQGFTDAYAVAD